MKPKVFDAACLGHNLSATFLSSEKVVCHGQSSFTDAFGQPGLSGDAPMGVRPD